MRNEQKMFRGGKRRQSGLVLSLSLLIGMLFVPVAQSFAQNSTIFGPNVYVFTPSDSVSLINQTLANLANNTEFSTNRYAVLFEPGTYNGVESQVGFYESVAGLGEEPTATAITNGYLTVNSTDGNGNLTTNFWRSLENVAITTPSGDTLQWGVSQGADFRRMYVNGGLELTNTNCGEASGGFISDSQITGVVNACSQQQWYTRNSSIGGWQGYVWNFVFSGVTGAPPQSYPFGTGANANTTLATTPVSREKPFLYMDGGGNYWVFSPTVKTSWSGTDWSNGGLGTGSSLPISAFFIATSSSTLAQINAALASGQNLILTPGIYQYSGSINITNPNTVVLGLGYADLVPQTGTAAMTVADVDGVQLAGFLIDAGPVNSPVLLQIGVQGAPRVSHASNPTSISDVHFRIGGATAGTATIATEIDSDNVIIDDMWSWRADHGVDASWTGNVAMNGLVVNGDNVTALGLAVEHYEAEQVVWNGEDGETIFYQSEMPYDVPSQAAWMNGNLNGYASYNVAPTVTNHQAYGLGVYSYFDQGVNIIANSGIAAPVASGVKFTDALTFWLNGYGSITYTLASNNGTVDNGGTEVRSGATISDVSSWGGSNGNCAAVPSIPGTPSGAGVSSSQINFTWGASTAGSSCTIGYNVYCSTTSGFTPSLSNLVASGLTTPSFADTNLVAATTYYCVIEAADGDGSSAASAQGSGTTTGNASCSAVPSAPTNLNATASTSSTIGLTWSAVTAPANCTIGSYSIYGGTTANLTTLLGTTTGTSYSNTGLAASTTYYYVVKATDADGSSAASAQVSAKTQAAAPVAPTAPTSLTATAVSSSQINLLWTASTTTGATYLVFQNGVQIGTATGTTYSVTGLAASTTYSFTVKATNSAGTSAAAGPVSATTQAAACSAVPAAPTNLNATASSSTAIGLTWSAVTAPTNCTISSYSIYGGTTANPTTLLGTTTGTSYSNTNLTSSTTYYYVVKATDADGSSAASGQVSAETLAAPAPTCSAIPTAPGGLTATATSSTAIGLTWTSVTAPANCSIASYNVYSSMTSGFTPGSGNLLATVTSGTNYSNTGLAASTTYYYVVEAVDGDGNSAASTQASATTTAGNPTADFTLGISPASLTVVTGQSGTETVTVTPENGFPSNSNVTLTCSGLPSGAACNFSSATVTSAGNITSTLTVTTTKSTAGVRSNPMLWLPGSALAAVVWLFGWKKRRSMLLMLMVGVFGMALFTGCGGAASGSSNNSQPVTSTITVTATSGPLQHTATFSLIVTTGSGTVTF